MVLSTRIIIHLLLSISVLTTATFAVSQPSLTSDAKKHYKQHHITYIRDSLLPAVIDPESRVEYYSHLVSGKPLAPGQAYDHSKSLGNGPIHVTYDRKHENAYATTKIPFNSDVGHKWGMNVRLNDGAGNEEHKDIYAFWHKPIGHRPVLLRLDAWPARQQAHPALSWEQVEGVMRALQRRS